MTYFRLFHPVLLAREIIHTGTAQLEGEEKKRVSIINTLSLASIALCLIFGTVIYYLTGNLEILLPAYAEALLFVVVLMLNHFRWHNTAAILTAFVHNLSIVYFSALLGMVTEVYLLFFFLLGAALMVFHGKPLLIKFSIAISVICLVLCELNYYYYFIEPLELSHYEQFLIRWVTIPAILVLDVLTFALYVRTLRRKNAQLERKATALEMADKATRRQAMETSHEMRNPFNAVYGISQDLLMQVQKSDLYPAELKASIEHLYSASHNVLQILNNNLEHFRQQEGVAPQLESGAFNVRDWAGEATAIYQYIANVRDVSIALEIDPKMPARLEGDKIKLTQILNNLLFNAIKFTHANSTVTVQIRPDGRQWQLLVKDSGDGIPPERLSTIFSPYVSEQHAFGGTGLGLPIVQRFVELMGGTIAVTSKTGEGSVFTVNLPLTAVEEAPAPEAPANKNITLQAFPGVKALVVDDNQMSNMILCRFLERMECSTSAALGGEEGLEKAIATQPDIIFLDSHMPGMDGKATLAALQDNPATHNAIVIIVSGDAAEASIAEMLAAGADDFMTKPIDLKSLNELMIRFEARLTTNSQRNP
ncbi:Signal transduction histidine kinase [Chitinophaga eiseniae]|uniref:histidine kinase n=1 Tax=Chitinophaga eiseniae TaxID=634771 RepID=A0A1T4M298_9BACT|nr:hybrid sensor histidine kinase/response regulator [Chitinophaga eiseniae]SJZ61120.1 Signal transduction histidine kinase [Chitinophaga eiseniae]